MKETKSPEEGGVACGICGKSLQEASYSFGVADMIHGIVGVMAITCMIIKKEGDVVDEDTGKKERATVYNEFLKSCPEWVLHWLFASFVVQTALGIMLALGATHRNSFVCSTWLLLAFFTFPTTPSTYCLIGLGRLFELATVLEFVWKMDEEEARYSAVKRTLERGKEKGIHFYDGGSGY